VNVTVIPSFEIPDECSSRKWVVGKATEQGEMRKYESISFRQIIFSRSYFGQEIACNPINP